MELWIRSQNKKRLIKANEIYLDNIYYDDGTVDILVNKFIFGRYVEGRALEILDEIQNIINPIIIFKNANVDEETLNLINENKCCYINNNSSLEILDTYAYQMPEE